MISRDEMRRRFEASGLFVAGAAAAMFLVAATATMAAPALDRDLHRSSSRTPKLTADAIAGMKVYEKEGCVYCHTQQVRPVSNDLGLGTVSRPDLYVRSAAPLLGLHRVGPDLSCVADRLKASDADVSEQNLAEYLRTPSSVRATSRKAGHSHLDDAEMSSLTAYLMQLSCGGGGGE